MGTIDPDSSQEIGSQFHDREGRDLSETLDAEGCLKFRGMELICSVFILVCVYVCVCVCLVN